MMDLELPFTIGEKVEVEALEELKGADCTLVGYKIEIGEHLPNDEIDCIIECGEYHYTVPSYLVSSEELDEDDFEDDDE